MNINGIEMQFRYIHLPYEGDVSLEAMTEKAVAKAVRANRDYFISECLYGVEVIEVHYGGKECVVELCFHDGSEPTRFINLEEEYLEDEHRSSTESRGSESGPTVLGTV